MVVARVRAWYQAHKLLGQIFLMEGDVDKGIVHFRRSIELRKDQPDLMLAGEVGCPGPSHCDVNVLSGTQYHHRHHHHHCHHPVACTYAAVYIQ